MQYMLIFRETDADFAKRTDPQHSNAYWGAWNAYIAEMAQAGIIKSGEGLQPPHTATFVRLRDGARDVQDGPHPDAEEHLGGFFVIEAPNLDAALDWAAKSPSAHYGSTEVRPVLPPMAPPAA
jgi:hypothetical protein